MINDMLKLAEAHVEFGVTGVETAAVTSEQKRMGLLSESHDVGTALFVLYLTTDGIATLVQQEVKEGDSWRLPFIKVAPNAPYLTPVFKTDVKKGMSPKKQASTISAFRQNAESGDADSAYFQKVVDVLEATSFRVTGEENVQAVDSALSATIDHIVASKLSGKSPLICIATDSKGREWPGNNQLFVSWLLNARERLSIYQTKAIPVRDEGVCPLTGKTTELFPNAIAGAGLNFVNGDYEGSFSELNDERAWQRAAISAEAADLLYIYKNHVAPAFFEYIAGSKALIIPSVQGAKQLKRFAHDCRSAVTEKGKAEAEKRILRSMAKRDSSVASITLLWATFGQKYEEATGMISHVLPSRLAQLTELNKKFETSASLFHPQLTHRFVRRRIGLTLSIVSELLFRPGGAAVKDENASPQRHAVQREIVAAVYQQRRMHPERFWKQVARTARAHLVSLLEQSDSSGVIFQLRYEGANEPKKQTSFTVNGWIRHLNLFLSYLSDPDIGVFEKENYVYEPTQENLKPLFADAAGLNNSAKQFTFMLGVLFGHLIYVQGAKAKVSVASNALSWIRSGRIRSADLPELCGKVTSKLLEYHALDIARKYRRIHEIEAELGHLGSIVGDHVSSTDLPDDKVLYFLMLGMTMSYTFTSDSRDNNPDSEQGATA